MNSMGFLNAGKSHKTWEIINNAIFNKELKLFLPE
jgi:hypothetical protein